MSLAENLASISERTDPEQFTTFREHIAPEWITETLETTGTATVRKRRLLAEQVVWLIIGMALFVGRSMKDLVTSLDLSLPGQKLDVARSAVTQARQRLGEAPLRWLFELTGQKWGTASGAAHRWRGLMLLGADMSTLRVADSQQNRDTFGGQSPDSKRGASGYPLVRLLCVMVLRSHILLSARMGPYTGSSELQLARDVLKDIPANSLIVLDRGYLYPSFLAGLRDCEENRHWLTRAKKNTKWTVIHRNGPGDEVVELAISSQARKKDPSLPPTLWCRAIRYQRKGFQPQTLLTSLMSASEYPAREGVGLYHERWEIELGYGEVKTDMLDRRETIRSKTPDGVLQEIWGLLIAYNLIRVEMEKVASEAGVAPTRISFIMALHLIQDEFMWCGVASPGTIPEKLRRMRQNISRYILPERRSDRSYPRAVKVKMSNYARKRPTTTSGNPVPKRTGDLK